MFGTVEGCDGLNLMCLKNLGAILVHKARQRGNSTTVKLLIYMKGSQEGQPRGSSSLHAARAGIQARSGGSVC